MSELAQRHLFYVCSLSANVIIYKGMLTPDQLFPFYKDLQNPRLRQSFGHGALTL